MRRSHAPFTARRQPTAPPLPHPSWRAPLADEDRHRAGADRLVDASHFWARLGL